MPKACDVAAYILKKQSPMTAMKLQKLLYYAQAWSLVWDDRALFDDRVEAWMNGPVVPSVYAMHRGKFQLVAGEIDGDASKVMGAEAESVDAVLKYYGDKTPQWLSDLTHSERPWKDARKGLAPDSRGSSEITHDAMVEFYGSL